MLWSWMRTLISFMMTCRLSCLFLWSKELMIYGICPNMCIIIGKEQPTIQQLYKFWFSTSLSCICWQIQIPLCQLKYTWRSFFLKTCKSLIADSTEGFGLMTWIFCSISLAVQVIRTCDTMWCPVGTKAPPSCLFSIPAPPVEYRRESVE